MGSDGQRLFEHFWQRYIFEHERKNKLDNQLSTILTGVSGIIFINFFVITKIYEDNNQYKLLALIFSLSNIFIICVAIAFGASGFIGRGYKFLEKSSDWLIFFKKTKNQTEINFEFELIDSMVSCIDHNAISNDDKSSMYYGLRLWFLWSLIPLAFLLVVFIWFLLETSKVLV